MANQAKMTLLLSQLSTLSTLSLTVPLSLAVNAHYVKALKAHVVLTASDVTVALSVDSEFERER